MCGKIKEISVPEKKLQSVVRVSAQYLTFAMQEAKVWTSSLANLMERHKDHLGFDYLEIEDSKKDLLMKHLECPICLDPLLEPLTVPVCEHFFCFHCIMTVKDKRCPLCKQEFDFDRLFKPNRVMLNILDNVAMSCKECNLAVERGSKCQGLENHILEKCLVPCPACAKNFSRQNMKGMKSVRLWGLFLPYLN